MKVVNLEPITVGVRMVIGNGRNRLLRHASEIVKEADDYNIANV
jgi:hypothetical protein